MHIYSDNCYFKFVVFVVRHWNSKYVHEGNPTTTKLITKEAALHNITLNLWSDIGIQNSWILPIEEVGIVLGKFQLIQMQLYKIDVASNNDVNPCIMRQM